MKIAVVILNWNGKKLLEEFLPSVVLFSNEATIYVADNASNDDSIHFINENFPTIKIIRNQTNGGYAKGYNDAIKYVNEDVLCLLNNDVEVSENWLLPIINCFQENPKTAIVQPKILDYNNKECFEYAGAAGGFIDKFGYPYCRGRIFNTIEKDKHQYDDTSEIFWASGACLFIKKSIFNKLNGFDETYFAHQEEIDLCWRAKNLGYQAKYVASSKVYHLGGGTLNVQSPRKTYLNFRNSLYNLVKNAKGNLFIVIFIRLVLDGIAGLKFLISFKVNHTFAIIKAHFSFYSNLMGLLKKRKSLKQSANYYNKTLIIWEYFIKNKRTFNSL
jgi:GT2 family glycosyltransferase